MSTGELVRFELDGAVAVLRLDDPDHRNALSAPLNESLVRGVSQAVESDARAIVLTATPPVFCSGGSLDALLSRAVPLEKTYEGFLALARAPMPTVAAVGGPAIGAGVNLALACDVVLTSPLGRFDPRFLDVGIHPGGGHLWRLRQRIGSQGAAALVLFGDVLTGEEAAAAGLAWRCVPDDALTGVAMGLARRVAERPMALVERTKATLRASERLSDVREAEALELEAQEWSMGTPDFEERVRAIREQIRRKSR